MIDEITQFATTIDITTILAFIMLLLFGTLGYTKKMSLGIAIACAIGGFGIAWIFSDYSAIVIHPVGLSLWYGYDWSISAILGMIHIVSTIGMVVVAGYNLISTGGRIIWA